MTVWIGPKPAVIISSADMAREILRVHDQQTSDRPTVFRLVSIFSNLQDIAFSPANQSWKEQRSLALLHLLSPKQLRLWEASRQAEVDRMVAAMVKAGNERKEFPLTLHPFLSRATLNNILSACAGRSYPYTDLLWDNGIAAKPYDWVGGSGMQQGVQESRRGEEGKDGAEKGERQEGQDRPEAEEAAAPGTAAAPGKAPAPGKAAAPEKATAPGKAAAAAPAPAAVAARKHGSGTVAKPAPAGKEAEAVEASEAMRQLVCKTDAEARHVVGMVDETFLLVGSFNIADFIPWLSWLDPQRMERRARKTAAEWKAFSDSLVDQRRAHLAQVVSTGVGTPEPSSSGSESERTTFLDFLLQHEEGGGGRGKVSKREIYLLLLDMIMAGTDTSSRSTEWALAELARRPDAQKRLQAEVDEWYERERGEEDRGVAERRKEERGREESGKQVWGKEERGDDRRNAGGVSQLPYLQASARVGRTCG